MKLYPALVVHPTKEIFLRIAREMDDVQDRRPVALTEGEQELEGFHSVYGQILLGSRFSTPRSGDAMTYSIMILTTRDDLRDKARRELDGDGGH